MAAMSQTQRLVFEHYAGGEYSYYLEDIATQEELDETLNEESERFGDTLFVFLLRELSPSEDCHDLETAARRVETSIEQLQDVQVAIEEASADQGGA